MLPKDPFILLSYVNTCLRDEYASLEDFCKAENIVMDDLVQTLASIDYWYNRQENRFV